MREVWGLKVENETYAVLKQLLQCVTRNSAVPLEVAMFMITAEQPDFISSETVFYELTLVLEKMTKIDTDRICTEILNYYQQSMPGKYSAVRDSLVNIKKMLSHQNAKQEDSLSDKTVPQTPVRRQYTRRVTTGDGNPLSERLKKYKFVQDNCKLPYTQQLKDCPESFSKPLQQQLELSDLYIRLQQFENEQINQNYQPFLYPENQLSYFQTSICQYHPQLQQIIAPPAQHFPKLRSRNNKEAALYTGHQIDTAYSNEAHDDPDISIEPKEYYSHLEQFKSIELPIYRYIAMDLTTKKPVPQHHSLLDICGCYVNYDCIFEGLSAEMKIKCQNNGGKVTMLDLLFSISKIKFFSPMQFFVDQRHYANESRYVKFVNSYPTAYLKAVGIGGSIRLQIHCSKDVHKDDEISLSLLDYFCCKKDSTLFQKMQKLIMAFQQMDIVLQDQPWLQQINEKIKPNHPHYDFFVESARAGFLVSFQNLRFDEFMEEIDCQQTVQLLSEGLRGRSKSEGVKYNDVIDIKQEISISSEKQKKKVKKNLNSDYTVKEEQNHIEVDGKQTTIQNIVGVADKNLSNIDYIYSIINVLEKNDYFKNKENLDKLFEQFKMLNSEDELSKLLHNFIIFRYNYYKFYNQQATEKPVAAEQPAKRKGRKPKEETVLTSQVTSTLESNNQICSVTTGEIDYNQLLNVLKEEIMKSDIIKQENQVQQIENSTNANEEDIEAFVFSRIFIKQYPCYYPNYIPYQLFNLQDYQTFDKFMQEKIYLSTFNFISQICEECTEVTKEQLTKILLRFVHQNKYFAFQVQGCHIDFELYLERTIQQFDIDSYTNVEPCMYQIFNVNYQELLTYYEGIKQQIQKGSNIQNCITPKHIQTVVIKLFNDIPQQQQQQYLLNIHQQLTSKEKEIFNQDATRTICDYIVQFLQNLPPLSKKLKVDQKKLQFQQIKKNKQAAIGYDGFYGWRVEQLPRLSAPVHADLVFNQFRMQQQEEANKNEAEQQQIRYFKQEPLVFNKCLIEKKQLFQSDAFAVSFQELKMIRENTYLQKVDECCKQYKNYLNILEE